MEETFHDITTKIRQRKKSMTCNGKEEVEGYFNYKTPGTNTIHTFFYSNISEFAGNLEGMLDEGKYRTINIICTILVGRHNNSSMMMFQCWVMVVVFHNILSFITQLNIYIK